ncbi:hypothetical protein HMPREF9141_2312 [Prevotella multiformis DSM 16608]|uniref:Uncharacterized protein n=1 Tax=Prevotella multiformis DSM 16608 TaxID=888743 RepID=F0F9P5_9BACT|nr:hypothetical protein HMPREF9141_2312 [Prevotella multiformis DSM 16608]
MDYRKKCRKSKLTQCPSISLSFHLLQTIYSLTTGVCKNFYAVQS